ncbi:hypothetical protein ABNG02_06390 [Halorubrum ejinorense]|uniref:Capsule polysaccharide biosynthesis protein n=1 Tax=Halorubrum ejinorense TaxID=425309 RepID=A0ABV4IK77_9EURY
MDNLVDLYEFTFGQNPWTSDLRVDNEIQQFNLDETERRGYVLFPLIPGYHTLCLRVCVLGHALRTRGYEPIILRDNLDLPERPEITISDKQAHISIEGCRVRSEAYPDLFNLKTHNIGEIISGDYPDIDIQSCSVEELKNFDYKKNNISETAMSSTKKYLKKYTIDLTDSEERAVFENFLYGGIILVDSTQKLLNKYNIEATIVSEPTYIQGNVPMKVCKRNEVPTYTQALGYHQNELIFGKSSNRNYMPQFDNTKIITQAINTQLSEKQLKRIDRIMTERKGGKITQTYHTVNTDISVENSSSLLVGIFSHLLWDGALEPEQALYDNIYDWLDETIKVAAEKENIQFIIKSHPAEEIRGTNESTGEWIEQNYSTLPDNIEFLPPDTDIDTYALIDDLDAGIVYASTVGLEMAYEGIPVVTGGYPPYHGFNITYDPSTKTKYREAIRNIEELDSTEKRNKRAQRFAHFLFVCKHMDFPPLNESKKRITHNEIIDERGPYIPIVEQILADEDIVQPDCFNLK